MPDPSNKISLLSRRALLKSFSLTPLLLRPAPFWGAAFLAPLAPASHTAFPFADIRFQPHYPEASSLADILRLVPPGSDDYITELYASQIQTLLNQWGTSLTESLQNLSALTPFLAPTLHAASLRPTLETPLRSGFGIDVTQRHFDPPTPRTRDQFLTDIRHWLGALKEVQTAEFEIYGLQITATAPLTLQLQIRYDLVALRSDSRREERVGSWQIDCQRESTTWIAHTWQAAEETLSIGPAIAFVDVTAHALASADSYKSQMLRGVDYWRTTLDGASGIDIYANNGVAAGDFDNDGLDDFYVCQPAGLPNRLYRNRGDGTFEDVTEKAGVAVLDNTACALFADFDNRGLQDLLVVCGSGPLLFLNQGNGTFLRKPDAFKFTRPPQGTFTHAALADYDNDGRLDIYFCTYMYYLGLDQYHYPVPYFDARNGPPNCLFRNLGNGTFVETTDAAGLNADNDRYSFACAWGNASSSGFPDLTIANDFGISQLYRNNGNGTFSVVSKQSHIEDVGAGMSASWSDFDNDGREDIYIASMWEAAGQRVSTQPQFHPSAPQSIRALYQRHAQGNALYQNRGDGTFRNIGQQAGVAMGRWSWSSDFWDFDHDGFTDLYVANGYISAVDKTDIASFFWRQVVAKSPEDTTPSAAYERGWNAINELIRSDNSWNAYERNVMFANNRNGTFSEASGIVGLDFLEDSRSFALADIDHDGRLEVILRNRNAPQLRILHNNMPDIGDSIVFRLRGHTSNRDAIGTAITVETGTLRQTKYLQAGSGFLAQHSKELFFGIGRPYAPVKVTVRWPGGLVQTHTSVPANHRIELEEGLSTFTAKPFAAAPAAYAHAHPTPPLDPLPSTVETWLLSPLAAPEFSLPTLTAETLSLQQLRGSFVLLSLWATTSPLSLDQLHRLNQKHSAFRTNHLELVALNIDDAAHLSAAQSLARDQHLLFPIAFATEETAGIYNIIYRYLFDRRRDLAIPTSFLLDREGNIIKLYQGPIDSDRVLADVKEDVKTAPTTPAQQVQRALPFKGTLVESTFQRNAFTYGVAMFQHGYLDQAAVSFQQVIASKPNDPEGYYNLGTLNLRRNDLPQARQYLETTVKLRPDYPEAWNNLGMISAQQGHPDAAIDNFQHALSLRPTYEIALLNLGNLYRRQRDFANASDALNRALALRPDDADVNYSLGMLHAQQNELQPAADFLQKAIDLRPAFAEALNNLGILYVRLQQLDKARQQFQTGIRLAPRNDQAYLNLARLDLIQNNKDEAREVLQQLLRLQPENAQAKQALDTLQ